MQFGMEAFASGPWPWYIAGPLIGLFVPALLIVGNRMFGVSSNLRHLCCALLPGRVEHFSYDWKRAAFGTSFSRRVLEWVASLPPIGADLTYIEISEETREA